MQVVERLGKEKEAAPEFARRAWGFGSFSLPADAPPRSWCISLVKQPWFDHSVLVLIFINCITMILFNNPVLEAMIESEEVYDPTLLDRISPNWGAKQWHGLFVPLGECNLSDPGPCSIVDYVDLVFLVLFAIEMVVKMLAYGLALHPHAYLRVAWNWLDFLVVVIGFIDMFGGNLPGISTLRLVKTLRPLRSLQRIRGMRVLVQCILEAMPQMCNVLVFLLFVIIFFGLFGHAFFQGKLRHTCHAPDGAGGWSDTGEACDAKCEWDDETMRLTGPCLSLGNLTWQMESRGDSPHFRYTCRPGFECRCASDGLPNPTCSYMANPNLGITSFDSIPWAMVSLFQAISLEGWVDMMYPLQDSVSMLVWIYFILLVLVGAIIVINLFLAVLCDNFTLADKPGDEEEIPKAEDAEEAIKRGADALVHTNPLRQMCLNLCRLKWFDIFIQGCILLNTAVMMTKYAPQPSNFCSNQYTADYTPGWYCDFTIDPAHEKWDYLPPWMWWSTNILNWILTGIFTLESIIKVLGLGPRLFVKDSMNVFDAVVVFFSLIEILFDLLKRFGDGGVKIPFPLSVLRAFRIIRLFKLARSIESMRKILATLISSMASVMYLGMLLGLIILIFILLGMELFGGRYPRPELNYTEEYFPAHWANKSLGDWDDDFASRYHFDDIGNAFLAIFVVLSGENWNEIMFNSHTATWQHDIGQSIPIPFAIIYFIGLFIVGNLLLFNLFIAILLSNFDKVEDEDEDEEEGLDEEIDDPDDAAKTPAGDGELPPMPPMRGESSGASAAKLGAKKAESMMTWQFNGYMTTTKSQMESEESRKSRRMSGRPSERKDASNGEPEEVEDDENKPQPTFPKPGEDPSGDRSMMLFSWDNPFRQACAALSAHWLFETVVIFLILVSTLALMFDMPHLSESHPLKQFLSACNVFFAVVFLIEMLIKWVACGVFRSKTPREYALGPPYFANVWNWLDGFIVTVSIVVFFSASLAPLRVFRALRPLRLVSRNEDLKITVNTLAYSVPAMSSLATVSLLFFIIFAILAIELYGGKLGNCVDPAFEDEPYGSRVIPGLNVTSGQNDYEECMALPRYNLTRYTTDGILFTDMADIELRRGNTARAKEWLAFTEFPQWMYPGFGNFDNLGSALLLLFEISALEGWPDVMHAAMDTDSDNQFILNWQVSTVEDTGLGGVGVPMQEHVTQDHLTAVFFCLWIFIGCFVVVNMTIGVVVDTFGDIKAENDGVLLMSQEASDWVKTQKQVLATRPLVQAAPPKTPWRLNVYYLVTSTKFEVTIMVVILMNMLQMATDWWEPAYIEMPTEAYPNCVPGGPNCEPSTVFDIAAMKSAMDFLNKVFLVIYWCEMLIKWVGLTLPAYFRNPWDCFDFFLVMISTAEVIVSAVTDGSALAIAPVVRVLRLFRVVRILRVIKTARQLRTIIMTVYISLPQLQNIMLLITLIILIFDMLCVSFFSFVNYTAGNSPTPGATEVRPEDLPESPEPYAYADDGSNWGDFINRHANFQFWWTGVLLLARSSTGESFNGLMHDCMGYEWGDNRMRCCPECGPVIDGKVENVTIPSTGETMMRIVPEDSCGKTFLALMVVYLPFQLIMAYVVLSIMVGVILENFANVGSDNGKVNLDDLEEFREVWLKYDPKGTFVVPSHNLLAILQQLKAPLGIAGVTPAMTRAEMLKHLGNLDIPDHGGYIHFLETLTAISNHIAGEPLPICETTNKIKKEAHRKMNNKRLDKPAHNALTNYLVSLLQSRWRGYAMRQKYEGGGAPGGGAPPQYEQAPPAGAVKKSQVLPEPPASEPQAES